MVQQSRTYKVIEPAVAGELGIETELDTTAHPPIVEKLHFEFYGWPGDDLIESFPCFLVTELLKERIEKNRFTGIIFESAKITKSENFTLLYPSVQLPKFYWAKISATNLQGDFSIGSDFRLIVSESAFNVLIQFNLKNALIGEIEG